MEPREVNFIDTTLRDGHASLWAEGMRTGMMLAVVKQIDEMGFKGIEIMATSHFKKCVRELKENPFERIRLVSREITHTPVVGTAQGNLSPFSRTPLPLSRLWFQRLAANGIQVVLIMEPSNDMNCPRMRAMVNYAHEAGMKAIVSLVYCLSPKHTDAYYAHKARGAVEIGADGINLKDPCGLLTPDRLVTLVPAVRENINNVPLELHSHCTTGVAPIVYVEAVRLGITTLHTAIPPLANGASQPSILNVIKNIRALGYNPVVEEKGIPSVTEALTSFAQQEGLPLGAPLEYDYAQYLHQVPGGVISNLRHQLSLLRMGHRLEEVLEEVIRVRKDLGYPIMVTPFSQFVVAQSTVNVTLGERYKQVPDELIQYTLGFWGEEASSAIDPEVKAKILSRPRAEEFAQREIYEPTLAEVRQKLNATAVSDDELILRYMLEEKEIEAMRAAGPPKEFTVQAPLVSLIRELAKRPQCTRIYLQKGDFTLTLGEDSGQR